MKVYKYPLLRDDVSWVQTLKLPKSAQVLSAGLSKDDGLYNMWALVDNEEGEMEERTFLFVGTGRDLPEGKWKFITTIQQPVIVHIFQHWTKDDYNQHLFNSLNF